MANFGKVFDRDVVGESNFAPLPDGWYTAQISKAEVKKTKDGTGSYVNIQYAILGPTHAGRVVFGMITVTNKNPKAEEIGEQEMTKLRGALGIARLTDSDQLIGGSLLIKIAVKPAVMETLANGQKVEKYPEINEIKGYKAIEGGTIPKPASSVPSFSKPAEPKTEGSAPPWASRKADPQPEIY